MRPACAMEVVSYDAWECGRRMSERSVLRREFEPELQPVAERALGARTTFSSGTSVPEQQFCPYLDGINAAALEKCRSSLVDSISPRLKAWAPDIAHAR